MVDFTSTRVCLISGQHHQVVKGKRTFILHVYCRILQKVWPPESNINFGALLATPESNRLANLKKTLEEKPVQCFCLIYWEARGTVF